MKKLIERIDNAYIGEVSDFSEDIKDLGKFSTTEPHGKNEEGTIRYDKKKDQTLLDYYDGFGQVLIAWKGKFTFHEVLYHWSLRYLENANLNK